MKYVDFSVLKGKTISEIQGLEAGSDRVEIKTTDGKNYLMWHSQNCCESVSIEDVVGDVADIGGSEILEAEEVTNSDEHPDDKKDFDSESFTWTFYKLSTIRGSITIRWYGTSNGYYSESVDFEEAA